MGFHVGKDTVRPMDPNYGLCIIPYSNYILPTNQPTNPPRFLLGVHCSALTGGPDLGLLLPIHGRQEAEATDVPCRAQLEEVPVPKRGKTGGEETGKRHVSKTHLQT